MRQLFANKATQADDACKRGEFDKAISIYTECIKDDLTNHVLFSNRSAAYVRTKRFDLAFLDGVRAVELQPTWPKVCFLPIYLCLHLVAS